MAKAPPITAVGGALLRRAAFTVSAFQLLFRRDLDGDSRIGHRLVAA